MKVPYSITGSTISVLIDNRPRVIPSSSPNFQALAAELRKSQHDVELLKELADLKRFVAKASFGKVQINNDEVRYQGTVVHGVIAERLLELMQAGHDVEPLARFLDRVMLNPLESARNELYEWLEAGKMPFTPDGCFLAFKAVRHDYKDKHSGTFDNSVGQTPSMPREEVDPDRRNECSRGLHFCSPGYLPSFARYGDPIMVLKIDPADVVAIPADYNRQKGRTWRYEVVGEVPPEEAAEQFFGHKPLVDDYQSQTVGTPEGEQDDSRLYEEPFNPQTDDAASNILNGMMAEPADYATVLNGASGQDRESYSDDQDRDSYTVSEPNDEDSAHVTGTDGNDSQDSADTPAISAKGKKMAISTTKGGNLKFSTKDGATFTAAQVRAAIKKHGGIRPAARALGVAKSTFQGWVALVA